MRASKQNKSSQIQNPKEKNKSPIMTKAKAIKEHIETPAINKATSTSPEKEVF